jgi:uncharacterized metal-binding protein
MSSTEVHDRVTLLAAGGISTLALVGSAPWLFVVASGVASGLVITPDWDWDGNVVQSKRTGRKYVATERKAKPTEKQVRAIYGVVANRWPTPIRQWIYVYAKLAKHRGVSHHWVLGTVSRVTWLGFPLVVLLFWPKIIGLWLAGLWLHDLLHLAFDKV